MMPETSGTTSVSYTYPGNVNIGLSAVHLVVSGMSVSGLSVPMAWENRIQRTVSLPEALVIR
jgi:hypothetical protein